MTTDWPPKSSFEPPRYPNAWLYVSERIAPVYKDAAVFVRDAMVAYAGFEDFPHTHTNPECADGQQRVHHIQPATGLPDRTRDHYHDLHIRYYFTHLAARKQHRVAVDVNGVSHACWRLPASVHYEPEPEHPGHPYIDECPICGVFPPFDLPGDRCEVCHDPLGLELLFYGTVRGVAVALANGKQVGGLASMTRDYSVKLSVAHPIAPDMNTLRIGVAVILPRT